MLSELSSMGSAMRRVLTKALINPQVIILIELGVFRRRLYIFIVSYSRNIKN